MWNKQTAALFPVHYTEIYSVRVSEKNSKIDSSRKCSISLQLMLSQRVISCSFRKLFSFLGEFFFWWFRLIGFTANLFLLASLRKVFNHFYAFSWDDIGDGDWQKICRQHHCFCQQNFKSKECKSRLSLVIFTVSNLFYW